MKEITEDDLKTIDTELASARQEFDSISFNSLDEKLKWIADFANRYIPELEKRFMTQEELDGWNFLPNDVRIKFYMFFPEHGLNMANYSQDLFRENAIMRKRQQSLKYNNIVALRHND